MSIYPNPASIEATINYQLDNEVENLSIILTDMQGKEILKNQIANPGLSGKVLLDLRNYSSGMYYVRIESTDMKEVKKLIINKD